ncbi:MAG: fibronectin type III domain-containing protein [Saprospiraceae bacterium]|nr:fibronectin type III domain-containing protein [Saprospiraceae bacterium]
MCLHFIVPRHLLLLQDPSCIQPAAPVNVIGTGLGQNSASLDWSAGSPSGSPAITYYWVVGTSSNVTYGYGVAQGTTASNWVGTNALSPNTTYYLRVYAISSCNNVPTLYSTSPPFTTSGPSCIQPAAPVNVIGTGLGQNSASLDWSAGSPSGSPAITYYWVVGTSSNVTFGYGVAQGTTASNWVGTNALSPNTTYYLRVYAISSCNNVPTLYSTSPPFTTSGPSCIQPAAPVNVIGTGLGQNSASLDWSSGNPAGSPTIIYYWVVGTSSTVTFGYGVDQGTTTSNWVGTNALSPNTTYYLRVYAISSCNNVPTLYSTSPPFTTSGPSCIQPAAPVNVIGTGLGQNSASLDWSSGSPSGSPAITYYWVVGTSSTVTYGYGVAQGTTTSNWVGTNALSPNTTYYLRVYAISSCNNVPTLYSTSPPFTTSGPSCIQPGKPINVFATPTGQNSASFDWSAGNPSGSPVITYYWVVGTSPSVTYGNGVAQGSLLGNWASTNALQPNTMYYLRVFAKSSCNNVPTLYSTSPPFTTSGPSCIQPAAPVNVIGTGLGQNSASLDWSAGSPSGSPAITYYWVVGTSSNVTFGYGVAQGTTASNWVGTNALSPNTTYYLRVYAISSCNNVPTLYSTSPPFTTSGPSCIQPAAPVNVIGTGLGQNSASLDWSSGNPAGSPTIIYYWVVGTSSTVTFGYGVDQGTTTSNWVGTNALSPNTTYYLRVYAISKL